MEEFRIRIRGVEVIVDSIESLDRLIDRYGGQTGGEAGDQSLSTRADNSQVSDPTGGHALDRALLKRFIEVEHMGIPSRELAVKLHANRKAVQIGLTKWANRIGLWHGNFQAIFEKNLPDGARGYRLTPEAISAGKDILGIQ